MQRCIYVIVRIWCAPSAAADTTAHARRAIVSPTKERAAPGACRRRKGATLLPVAPGHVNHRWVGWTRGCIDAW